jgi:hypothetical protein
MAKFGAVTPTTVTAAIYSRDNGNPVASLGSVSIDASGWGTSGANRTFTFSSPIAVTAGEYAIVLTEGVSYSVWVGMSSVPASPPYALITYDNGTTWYTYGVPARSSWFIVYGNLTGSSYVDIAATIAGTGVISGTLTTDVLFLPPMPTYWYSTGTPTGSFYYRLRVQSDGNLGTPPPTGVENTDYTIVTYLPNFIRTNRRLVAAAKTSFYYEEI